jgi:hypothetical protein
MDMLYILVIGYPVLGALAIMGYLSAVWLLVHRKKRSAAFAATLATALLLLFVYYREVLIWLDWLGT